MKLTSIIKYLGEDVLNRHDVYNWDRYIRGAQNRPTTKRSARRSKRADSEEYTPDQIALIGRMLQESLRGFSPDQACYQARRVGFKFAPAVLHAFEQHAELAAELISRTTTDLLTGLIASGVEEMRLAAGLRKTGLGLDALATSIAQALGAEHCSLFLTHRKRPTDLVLVADSKAPSDPNHIGYSIVDYKTAAGLTARVASSRKPINLFGPELEIREPPSQLTTHLKNPRRSILAVPLITRKSQLAGVIKVENKSPLEGMNFGAFDAHDEILLSAYSGFTLTLLELQRLLRRGVELLSMLDKVTSWHEFGDRLLELAMRAVNADRAEITRWHERVGLVFEVVAGDDSLQEGDVLAPQEQKSITYGVYAQGKSRCIPDVTQAKDYLALNAATRSEIAAPILVGGRPIGVLNVESELAGDDGGLDEGDRSVVETMARFASIAAELMATRDAIITKLDEMQLEKILEEAIRAAAGDADRGVLYVADYWRGELRLTSPRGTEPLRMPFDKRSLASKVIRERKAYYSLIPDKDPHVWAEGLNRFGVRGSMVGIPLVFRTASSLIVAGVVVLWRNDGARFTKEEAKSLVRRCTRVCNLSVVRTDLWMEAERRPEAERSES